MIYIYIYILYIYIILYIYRLQWGKLTLVNLTDVKTKPSCKARDEVRQLCQFGPARRQLLLETAGAKRREWMGCWGLLGLLLVIMDHSRKFPAFSTC